MKLTVLNLLSLILLIASVTGLVAAWLKIAEQKSTMVQLEIEHESTIAQMETELKSLRQEAGYLSIKDRSKIHAVAVQTTGRNVWKYKVFLPANRTYYLANIYNSLPSAGRKPSIKNPAKVNGSISLENGKSIGVKPGEYIVSYSIHKVDGIWKQTINIRKDGSAGRGSEFISHIQSSRNQWPYKSEMLHEGGVTDQVEKPTEEGCILLDLRSSVSTTQISSSSPQGTILWIGAHK